MVTPKVAGISKNQILALLNDFLQQFQNWCNLPNEPTAADLEKVLSRNFQISSNGEIRSKNLTDYLNRLNKLRKKYSHFEITGPLEEPLIFEDKVFLHYEVELQERSGQKKQIYIMALGTLENNKFSKWMQVSHEKSATEWDT
jgi:hypothetical protein